MNAKEEHNMKTYIYKGYEIEKINHNTFRIRPEDDDCWIDMRGHYPKTLKEAKAVVDELIKH